MQPWRSQLPSEFGFLCRCATGVSYHESLKQSNTIVDAEQYWNFNFLSFLREIYFFDWEEEVILEHENGWLSGYGGLWTAKEQYEGKEELIPA